jgi:uncharacterized protein (DUF2384 family)
MGRSEKLLSRVGGLKITPPRRKKPATAGISPESITAHALETFGSTEKAQHWMNRPNSLFGGKTPSQLLRSDPVEVEAELVRIDHGVDV